VAAVRASLHQLEVVVREPPEEALDELERPGVLVAFECDRRLLDDAGELVEHRAVERVCDLGLGALERQGEARGVQDLDREPSPDLDLLLVEGRIDPESRARGPIPHGVGSVLL
jgi:hypothetical protein